MERGEFEI